MPLQPVKPLEALRREFGQGAGGPLLERLLAEGLVDMRAAEYRAIRHRYGELVARGSGRVDAMYRIAAEFNCSYEKIRSIIYHKTKIL